MHVYVLCMVWVQLCMYLCVCVCVCVCVCDYTIKVSDKECIITIDHIT